MERKISPEDTYFVVSDIHGFYDELIEALGKKGFNSQDPNHILVVVGDIFDRGPKSYYVYTYLKGLNKDRRILIRGNHEDMFLDLFYKRFPHTYDFHNRTVDTFCQLTGYDEEQLLNYYNYSDDDLMSKLRTVSEHTWKDIVKTVSKMDIHIWIESDEWVDYFELGDFIFTHSFIPLRDGDYNPNWRVDATYKEWEKYRTGCPWRIFKSGYFKEEQDKGKTLVFGHWHTSEIHKVMGNATEHITDIFYGDGFIALDAGVFIRDKKLVHPCNVLVIKDGKVIK